MLWLDELRSEPASRMDGRLFGSENDQLWWDDKCLFHPIVVRDPSASPAPWRMYYYGRDQDSWHCGVTPALISTGCIGMAVSEDGLHWKRFLGPLHKGALMCPSEKRSDSFDCVHVGCSDVLLYNEEWWMFYFGGSLEEVAIRPQESSVRGFRMRTGLTRSRDGIVFKHSMQPILEVGSRGEWDELFVAWARVLPPSNSVKGEDSSQLTHWWMTYSSMEGGTVPSSAIGAAISDNGKTWKKLGKILQKGSSGSWDEAGVGRRHVLQIGGKFVMFYEGVNKLGMHGIGIAISEDGLKWEKDLESGAEPGGPVFVPRRGQDVWDSGTVAAPHVVQLEDGNFRLYYVGSDSLKKATAIGLAISDGHNFRSWKRANAIG
ncbi:hypothetical protein O6H91_16G055200 [Diphasiastrum complanatum]|uniref:Uncharacterized protein n=1 Tax=Diphasiastrum complanatum TaxID=34168 RepID=A0ACC2BCL8_DIPCM|nr:hypothetical protein O6H91_16G055200 [Diphasiastrum complanatum]